ncbi:DUF6193 family natural product biosynthesis protein [Micromonospora sp. L32]|uniref:DUF6193 family natural product biosynthesis protein n=1 Tax=unclassified Micromonospora TaxID=2617518 RepID=UPI003F8A666A
MTRRPDPAVLYPDVAARGSLAAALQAVAVEQGLSFPTASSASDPLRNTVVPSGTPHRDDLAVNAWHLERRWSISGNGSGRRSKRLIGGDTQDLAEVARAAQAWRDGLPLADIQQVAPFVELTQHPEVPDQNPDQVIASKWQYLRMDAHDSNWPEYRALLEAAYAEPKLRRLYPYTSHWSLNFSASTLLPHVSPPRGGSYDVVSPRGVFVAETDQPAEALALVLDWMPDDISPATPSDRATDCRDPLWEEVERRCDAEHAGAWPRFCIENTSVREWQLLYDLVNGESWPQPTPREPRWTGTLPVTYLPTSRTEICFDVNLNAVPAEWRMETLLDYLEHLCLKAKFQGPILMAPESDPTHPVLAFSPLRGTRVRLLPPGVLPARNLLPQRARDDGETV